MRQLVWGLGGRKWWQGSAGWQRRRSWGRGGVFSHRRDIRKSLAQDLKVLGCLVVLLVELGSICDVQEGENG